MTRNQRRLFLILHTVREMSAGMQGTGCLTSKSRGSLSRIMARVDAETAALGPMTPADARHFRVVAARLQDMWDNDTEETSRPAFVSICLSLLADYRAGLPRGADRARAACADLEAMLFTLYKHFDPDLEDTTAMNQGERIAKEFSTAALAA